jgi:hypothetical protein
MPKVNYCRKEANPLCALIFGHAAATYRLNSVHAIALKTGLSDYHVRKIQENPNSVPLEMILSLAKKLEIPIEQVRSAVRY